MLGLVSVAVSLLSEAEEAIGAVLEATAAFVVGCDGAAGGLEGVLELEGVGVDVAGAGVDVVPKFSLISPYSFHSSTSSRS